MINLHEWSDNRELNRWKHSVLNEWLSELDDEEDEQVTETRESYIARTVPVVVAMAEWVRDNDKLTSKLTANYVADIRMGSDDSKWEVEFQGDEPVKVRLVHHLSYEVGEWPLGVVTPEVMPPAVDTGAPAEGTPMERASRAVELEKRDQERAVRKALAHFFEADTDWAERHVQSVEHAGICKTGGRAHPHWRVTTTDLPTLWVCGPNTSSPNVMYRGPKDKLVTAKDMGDLVNTVTVPDDDDELSVGQVALLTTMILGRGVGLLILAILFVQWVVALTG